MADGENQHEIVIRAHGDSPESVAVHLLQEVLALLMSDRAERDAASVVPLQASGGTLAEMLEELMHDFLEIAASSPTSVIDAELSHVMNTGDGLRAWGYVWLGSDASMNESIAMKDHLELSAFESGGYDARVTLLASDTSAARQVRETQASER